MPRRRLILLVSAVVLAAAALPVGPLAPVRSHAANAHPSLLFSASDVTTMQQAVQSGEPALAWASLKRKADAFSDPTSPSYANPALVAGPAPSQTPNWRWYDGLLGQNQQATYLIDLSFAYLISGDPKYGNAAINLLLALSADNWPAWGDAGGGAGLGRGDLLRGVGMAFDWTYNLMTAAQRLTIVQSLTDPNSQILCGSDATGSCNGSGGNPGSNHTAVGPGGTGLALLAIQGEPGVSNPTDLQTRLNRVHDRVLGYMQASYDVNGDGHEGVTYAAYALHAAVPFSLAWQRSTAENLLAKAPNVANVPLWLTYEQLPGRGMQFVPRNDGGTLVGSLDEVLPTLFAVRSDGVPGWLYDHTMGPQGDATFANPVPYQADNLTGNHSCTSVGIQYPTGNVYCGWTAPEAFTIIYYKSPAQLARPDPASLTPLSQRYPKWGLVDMRTGWNNGVNDVVATYEAKHGEVNASHWQYDLGQFTVYGFGANFAVDSAYGHNYSCSSTTAVYQGGCPTTEAGSPVGHNVVLVGDDSLPQVAHDFTQINVDIASSNETIPVYVNGPTMTFLRSDLRSAYNTTVSSVPLAQRDMFFGRAAGEPVIIAVTDTLQPHAGADSYRWQMHTDGSNAIALLSGGFRIVAPNGAQMSGQVSDAAGTPNVVPYAWDETIYDQFESPLTHTILTSRTPPITGTTAEMDHLALMAVVGPGAANPVSSVLVAGGGTIEEITWNGKDILAASRAASATSVSSGRLTTDGSFAKVTSGAGETMLDQGTSLVLDGVTYVQVTGGAATVQVSGSSITASGPTGAAYTVFAPQTVSSVTVNGTAVNSCRTGNTLKFPC